MMLKNYICYALFTMAVVFESTAFSYSQNISFSVSRTGVDLLWQNKPRLAELFPFTQGDSFKSKLVWEEAASDGKLFRYTDSGHDRQFALKVLLEKNNNVVSFWLSGDGRAQLPGTDSIGLFFRQMVDFKSGLASFRYKPVMAWTTPIKINKAGDLKENDIQFFIWQYKDGTFAAAMPLGGNGFCGTIGRNGDYFGVKSVSLKDSMPVADIPLVAIAFGTDPYQMVGNLYEAGMRWMSEENNLRKKKDYPSVLENIGWCTWNALGYQLSEEKIIQGVRSFTNNNFPLPFLLIDDGWLSVNDSRLKDFHPDPEKFPNGFKPLIDSLHQNYKVKHVGVWHTLNGYWAGIDTSGVLAKKYNLVPYRDKVTWTDKPIETFFAPAIDPNEGFKFYDDWYGYLKSQGISMVKVDNQLIIDRIAKGNYPLWEAAGIIENNLQSAVQKNFNGAVINCMDMTANAFYHYSKASVARASEDFLPENKTYNLDGGNAAVHVLCAITNSMWLSEMVWPDFDMFQTHHPQAEFHAVARAISGGPVYVTDIPGKQNFDMLRALTYRDGTIIRADQPARPTMDCILQGQDPKPFKAFTISNGTGLLAAFNVADTNEVKGTFSPGDVYGLQSEKFVVYDYFEGTVSVVRTNQEIPITLGRLGYKLYVVAPLNNNGSVAIGLLNKYNAPKTIINQENSKGEIKVTLPEGGKLGIYLAHNPQNIWVDDKLQPTSAYVWDNGLLVLNIPEDSDLEIRRVKVKF